MCKKNLTQEERNYVQVHIDYHFKNIGLLEQAFTRSSYSAEHGGGDNEILEFIGDKALDLVVVKYLSEKYGSFAEGGVPGGAGFRKENRVCLEVGSRKENGVCIEVGSRKENGVCFGAGSRKENGVYLGVGSPVGKENYDQFIADYSEGELTEMKAQLVQKKALAKRMDYLGFGDFLIMGKGDEKEQVNRSESVKEDLFEAIVGAVTLDSGWDLEVISHVAENMLEYSAGLKEDEDTVNYIGRLQDWALAKAGELPLYHVQKYETSYFYTGHYVTGNSRAINDPRPRYMCFIKLPGMDQVFLDFGDSQGEARMCAAKTALQFVHEKGLDFTIRDEIPEPCFSEAINQLEILSRRGYFPLPTYDFTEVHDADGNPCWEAVCHVKGYADVISEDYPVKKMAKKNAAYEMLKKVLGI